MLKGEKREKQIKEIWERVENKCQENSLELITTIDEYKNNTTRLFFICNKHENKGIQNKTVTDLIDRNAGCKYCGYERSSLKNKIVRGFTFEKIFSEFDERGYNLLSKEYINAKEFLMYQCRKHPEEIQYITYDKFSQGHGCQVCRYETLSQMFREDFEVVKNAFEIKNLTLLTDNYINSDQSLEYICNKHINKGIQTITYDSLKGSIFGCKYCVIENMSGENNWNWKGGNTPLHNYLRDKTIKGWKISSFEKFNWTCIITGIKLQKNIIHHLYSFSNIVYETLDDLKYPVYNAVNKYTKEELRKIEQLCLEKHYKYGLGVCLTKPIHNLFHKLYGKGSNTSEQFQEFTQRYYNFEFDDLLEEKYKYKNIILKKTG